MDIEKTIEMQKKFYKSGKTLSIEYRIASLKKLAVVIKEHIPDMEIALYKDLGKSPYESYLMEIGFILNEISYTIKHISKWCKQKWVFPSKMQFPSLCYISPHPYGNVLIMAPWNYPFILTLCPLIGAVAAGNCAIVKPSAYSFISANLIDLIINEAFERGHVDAIIGGRKENAELLDKKFQYIFFTGSVEVGNLVMEKAARFLTPVTLELGGKSPCIVDDTADIKRAAKRIVFGKFVNAGQTCIAPDYVLVHEEVYKLLLENLKKYIIEDIRIDSDYGHIVNTKHFSRLLELLKEGTIYFGGGNNEESLCIEPTIVTDIDKNSKVMQEEIFGPILPIIPYRNLDEVIDFINENRKPLALYYFTKSNYNFNKVLKCCNFGGGCQNDTILHMATSHMPFGGVGDSGMGNYHGKYTFDTFSHYRSIMKNCCWFENPMRYKPYSKMKEKIIKYILK